MTDETSLATEENEEEESQLHVVLVTGDRPLFDGAADWVIAEAVRGQIAIGVYHAPMVAMLDPGELTIRLGEKETRFAVGGGFVQVLDNEVIILADTAERPEEIDITRAEAARRRAELLLQAYRNRPESTTALQALRRSRARIRVARRQGDRR